MVYAAHKGKERDQDIEKEGKGSAVLGIYLTMFNFIYKAFCCQSTSLTLGWSQQPSSGRL